MISRRPAGDFGTSEIELMMKVLLIEDDAGTAEEILAELSELGS
jgi:two-component system OmpR family response regulator